MKELRLTPRQSTSRSPPRPHSTSSCFRTRPRPAHRPRPRNPHLRRARRRPRGGRSCAPPSLGSGRLPDGARLLHSARCPAGCAPCRSRRRRWWWLPGPPRSLAGGRPRWRPAAPSHRHTRCPTGHRAGSPLGPDTGPRPPPGARCPHLVMGVEGQGASPTWLCCPSQPKVLPYCPRPSAYPQCMVSQDLKPRRSCSPTYPQGTASSESRLGVLCGI